MKIDELALDLSVSTVRAPSNFGSHMKLYAEGRVNWVPVMRDALSNFQNFPPAPGREKKIFTAVIGSDSGPLARRQFLVVGHNGKRFEDMNDILHNGCTPYRSGETASAGSQCFGSGLSFGGSTLKDRPGFLAIASKTADGSWIAGGGLCANNLVLGNRWIVSATPEIVEFMENHLDKKTILEDFNVLYFFEVPFRGDDHNPVLENLSKEIMTTLALISGNMLDDVSWRTVEGLFIPNHQWKNKDGSPAEKDANVLKLTSHDSYGRKLKSKANYIAALANNVEPFVLVVPNFVQKIKGEAFHGEARVKIWCFDGKKKNDNPWLLNARSNKGADRLFPQFDEFEKDSGSGWGAKPAYQTTLTANMFGESHPSYGRYKDQAVAFSDNTRNLLAAGLGITNYTGQKTDRKDERKDIKANPSTPFVHLEIGITKVNKKVSLDGVVSTDPDIVLDFINLLGRRPDHLVDKDMAYELMQTVMQSVKIDKDSPEIKPLFDWFAEHFPVVTEEFTPIMHSKDGKTDAGRFQIHNLIEDGAEYDYKPHLGYGASDGVFAIWDCHKDVWVEKVDHHPRTRGIRIRTYDKVAGPIRYQEFLDSKKCLKDKVEAFEKSHPGLNIPLHVLEVDDEITRNDGKKDHRFLDKKKRYDHTAAFKAYEKALKGTGDDPETFSPTRQAKGKVAGGPGEKVVTINFGMITDVPKPPKVTWEKKEITRKDVKTSCAGGIKSSHKGQKVQFEERHPSVPVKFVGGTLYLNPNYEIATGNKPFAIFKNPDTPYSPTQKVAEAMWQRVFATCQSVWAAMTGIPVLNFDSFLKDLPHRNEGEDGKVYDSDPKDYVINVAVDNMIRIEQGDKHSFQGLAQQYHALRGVTETIPVMESMVEVPAETV